MLAPQVSVAAPNESCASDAVAHAKPLLAFHFGDDDRIEIEKEAKELPPIRNPRNTKQKLKVYEVWGYIYKGEYRMRFLYFYSPTVGCLLMGQEVLAYSSP